MEARLIVGSSRALLVVLLSAWVAACDGPSPMAPSAPGSSSALQIDPCAVDTECDGSTDDTWTDEDYASIILAEIYDPSTFVDLSTGGDVGAHAVHEFMGSQSTIKLVLNVSFEGHHRDQLYDDNEYITTVSEWLSEALGVCSSVLEVRETGMVSKCAKQVTADISPVPFGGYCGWSGDATTDHAAWMIVKGTTWSSATDRTGDRKSQRSCYDDGTSGSDRSDYDGPVLTADDGGDPAGVDDPTCNTIECTTWYWYNPDTGEIYNEIYTSCTCTSWDY